MSEITQDRREAFRFMLEHAGYCVPPGRAACALELARAEELANRAELFNVARFEVRDDPEPYDPGDVDTPEDVARYFDSGRWLGPYVAAWHIGEERYAASCGGIVVGPAGELDPYLRVMRAELASELEDDLRQAIGDALDAAAGMEA